MIGIKGLHKYYNRGKQNEIHVVNDVTLDLPERGICAIYGKSGCGKTTLLNLIGGLDSYSRGSISIEGMDVSKNPDDIRNKYIGYIFQNYNLSRNESCFDNVAAALRLCGMNDETEIERRVVSALRKVGMEKYARRTPDTLSGGQQQRIAIARAIVKNPPIILADEPTGNLDEANTRMIMDLLRAIADEHLVVLVTHEATLVDAYCDRIIELSDGKIVNVREGRADGAVSSRSKQDIYLGELEHRRVESSEVDLDYYGEPTPSPVKLTLVNRDGHLYLKLGSDKVHIIDDGGEIRLIDGVYEEKREESAHLDMSDLPRVIGNKFGTLFTLKSSVVSGYRSNFSGVKKGKKALRFGLILFAAVTVLMSAVFGRAIGGLIDLSDSYNHNVFYVYTPDGETSEIIHSALSDESSAVDYLRLNGYLTVDNQVAFSMASFESFSQSYYGRDFSAGAVLMDTSLCRDSDLLVGEMPTTDEGILISDKVADVLLGKSAFAFMDEYSDLIGLTTSYLTSTSGNALRITGVVKTGESAIYLTEKSMAKQVSQSLGISNIMAASDYGFSVEDGKTILLITGNESKDKKVPKVGDSIKIRGRDYEVSRIITQQNLYSDWLKASGIVRMDRAEYFASTYPDNPNAMEEKYFEYEEYYYEKIDDFLNEKLLFDSYNLEAWLYIEKGIAIACESYFDDDYCKALDYWRTNGRYPTQTEFEALRDDLPGKLDNDIDKLYAMYENEMYFGSHSSIYFDSALISDNDYVMSAKLYGTSDDVLNNGYYYYNPTVFTVIHSTDLGATEAWLTERLGHITSDYYQVIITPTDVFTLTLAAQGEEILGAGIGMLVLTVLMSICMYFIMRASLMNRIKEVGIYRAIGVSKRNLIFRFAIESLVLCSMTVLIGYALMSGYIGLCLDVSPLVSSAFYYPLWYALIVLALLVGVCVICGILPILSLLRKTPSEILAKYDI